MISYYFVDDGDLISFHSSLASAILYKTAISGYLLLTLEVSFIPFEYLLYGSSYHIVFNYICVIVLTVYMSLFDFRIFHGECKNLQKAQLDRENTSTICQLG